MDVNMTKDTEQLLQDCKDLCHKFGKEERQH